MGANEYQFHPHQVSHQVFHLDEKFCHVLSLRALVARDLVTPQIVINIVQLSDKCLLFVPQSFNGALCSSDIQKQCSDPNTIWKVCLVCGSVRLTVMILSSGEK